ncbi:MAG TPA: hypothetical protein VFI22_08675, partial [Thermomicrobiales bacterium]|nr:hypothetical protein [Thermomicrobiales bacterium]
MSLRSRLSIAVALVLLGTLLLAGSAILGATRAALVGQVDDQLRTFALRAGPRPGGHGPGSGPSDDGHGDDGHDGPPPVANLPADSADFFYRPEGRFLVGPGGRIIVAESSGY